MRVTLKQLQLFVSTVKLESLSAGADACFITQAAASISLAQLEQAIGKPLFDRVGKRLRLNPTGELILPKAMAIIDQTHELQNCTDDNTTISGLIEIGASTTIANYVLPPHIAQFKALHPAVDFKITIANTDTIVQNIHALNIDFGLIEGICHDNSIERQTWQKDALAIICSKKHPLMKKKHATKKDLLNYPWAVRESGSGTRDVFEHALPYQDSLNVEITLASSEAISAYVANSHCLGYLSDSVLSSHIQSHSISSLSVKNFNLSREFYCLTHKNKHQSQQANLFQQHLYTEKKSQR